MELFNDLMEDPSTVVRRMSPFVRSFLAGAIEEYPPFLEEYVIPTLCGPDPEGTILADLETAAVCDGLESTGLGEYSGNLGFLGKSIFKKISKVVKKVAKAPIKIAKKEIQITKKVHNVLAKDVKKVAKRYGDTIITAAGAVLAPFTGGASMAIASGVVAADVARKKRLAANKAKKIAKQQAAQVQQDTAAAQNQESQQLDQFYHQNQSWFTNHGVTADQWAAMSNDQRVAAINAAASSGSSAPAPQGPSGDQSAGGGGGGGGYGTPGGGGGGGGADGGGSQSSGQPQVAKSGMFDSSMLPLLGVGAVLALFLAKPEKGRRTRRNPRRRRAA